MVYFLDGDKARHVVVESLENWLQMHEVEVVQGPYVLLVYASRGGFVTAELAIMSLVVELLEIVVMNGEDEVACLHYPAPALKCSSVMRLVGTRECKVSTISFQISYKSFDRDGRVSAWNE